MKDNIIDFPLERRMDDILLKDLDAGNIPEEYMDEDVDSIELQILIDDTLTEALNHLWDNDIPVSDKELTYDISFLYESIKSIVLKTTNKYHPIQDFAYDVYHKFDHRAQKIPDIIQMQFDFDDPEK